MSRDAVIDFFESIAQQPSGLLEFQSALNNSIDAVINLGAGMGYSFNGTELQSVIGDIMQQMPSPDMLSEMELDQVAGGAVDAYSVDPNNPNTRLSSNNLKQIGLALHGYNESWGQDTIFKP